MTAIDISIQTYYFPIFVLVPYICVLDIRSKLVAFLLVMSGDEFIPPLDAGAIVSQLKAYVDEKLQDIKPRDDDSEVPLK